ncbi:MAG: histidinol dehydrogenase, partial [Alphaproteobacteria bacterium]|nr:histidinol dehydrogenase [Alphaproteobacteria bacterium]
MHINVWTPQSLTGAERIRIFRRAESNIHSVAAIVEPIIEDVRLHGDDALRRYAEKLDGAVIKGGLSATEEDFEKAYKTLDPEVTEAIRACAENVKIHHRQQMDRVERQWMEEVR